MPNGGGTAGKVLRLAEAPVFRRFGRPRLLPLNLTLSVTFRCNFRCATCNVYERKVRELELWEWEKIFRSLGSWPLWITVSGGEPFLRRDLAEIVHAALEHCGPKVLNIATNGWFTGRVVEGVRRIASEARGTKVVVNLSFDHHQAAGHDAIRGAPGSYARLVRTLEGLKGLGLPNLTVGVHTVVSRFNQDQMAEVAEGLARLGADSYIAEPAEERAELLTLGAGISPDGEGFSRAAAALLAAAGPPRGKVARLVRAVRGEYYARVSRYLAGERGSMPVCHAGFISGQIGADGEVWSCCVLARSLGNLREVGYDFRKVWFSGEAREFRAWMRRRRCACPLANAAYTNLILEPGAAIRILASLLRPSGGGGPRGELAAVPSGSGGGAG